MKGSPGKSITCSPHVWVDLRDILPSFRRKTCLVEYDATLVSVRGEELSNILWRGRQWAVTTHGIEALDGTYSFEAHRLAEDLHVRGYGGWPSHMSEKDWVDIDDFITAWLIALTLHGEKGPYVRQAVANSRPAGKLP